MKRYTKFLSVLLCLVVLISVVTMAATAQEAGNAGARANDIKQGVVYKPVSPSRLTTVFGCYRDFTGNNESTFADGGDGYCLTDGWYGRAGYANCTYRSGLVAAIITVDDVINLGGIEIVANDNGSEGDGDPIRFEIQAWVDGKWVLLASEDQYLFDATRAANYTFDAVRTAKVRILIHSYYDREARLKEITLFEETTGNLTKTLNLNGKIGESDAENSYVANYLIDGNKASGVEFTDTLIDVDTTGKGVVVDGFVLYPHRADREFPTEVTISFLTVGGSWFEEIGTYKTNWRRNSVLEPLVITFDQPYIITAAIVNISTGSLNEFELFQFQRTQPVVMPTVPTEPTEAPTRPTTAPTEPTEAPTEPEATEPEATEPEATEPEATQPEVTEPEATEPEATQPAATEPEVTEPEVTEPEATEPEATEPEATKPEATEPEATEPEETQPEATQPEATQPAGEKSDTAEEPKSNTGLIISIVAAIVVVAAVVVVVLKKKS